MTDPTPEVDLDDATDDDVLETAPDDAPNDWTPEGYEPGPDEPGDIDTECGAPEEDD